MTRGAHWGNNLGVNFKQRFGFMSGMNLACELKHLRPPKNKARLIGDGILKWSEEDLKGSCRFGGLNFT